MQGSRFLVGCVLAIAACASIACSDEPDTPVAPTAAPREAPTPAEPAERATPEPPPTAAAEPAQPTEPTGPALAPPRAAPTPLVTAEIPLDEHGAPAVVPALRGASRIGAGPWVAEAAVAFGAGVFVTDEDPLQIVHELERGRMLYALVSAPPSEPPSARDRGYEIRSLWLAQLESRGDEAAGTLEHRRIAAIHLYDGAVESQPLPAPDGFTLAGFTCTAELDLRARDVDADRELEVTVVAPWLRPVEEEECGAVAFIVGVSDWNVQAAFTRDYAVHSFAASIEVGEMRSTTWQLRDVDGDGHSDLHVTERWRFLDNFMGDYVGDGETMPPSRNASSDRRELDCLYDVAHDAWRCPLPEPGTLLFSSPEARDEQRGRRPW